MTNNIPGQRCEANSQAHTELAPKQVRTSIAHGRHPHPHTWVCSETNNILSHGTSNSRSNYTTPKPTNQYSEAIHTQQKHNKSHKKLRTQNNHTISTITPKPPPPDDSSSKPQHQLSLSRSASVSSPLQPEEQIVVDIPKLL
jgi:hypothetical protein